MLFIGHTSTLLNYIVLLLIVGGACSAGKASEVAGLEAVGSLIHSRWPERLQRPNPSTLPDFS